MGTFVGIVGKTEVPKEHLETYVKQMLTVWKYGGMMQYETVRLYGKSITLIHSPEFDADEWYMICQYNYFENDSWQPCVLNQLGDVCTGKVGQHQLRDVMQAARVLVELSSKNDALALMNGRLFLTDKHIGWLNQILGTDFKTRCAGDIQKVLRLYPKDALEDKCMEFFRLYGKRPEPCTAEPVSTADFLNCSPDDLVFLWTATGNIEFSKTMWGWLDSLRVRIDALAAAGKELIPPADFLRTMVTILSEIDPPDTRNGNYAFRNMFYDWIQSANNLRVQASLLLLQELAAEPSGAGQCVSNLRRYLAVLGNKELRECTLGICTENSI